MNKETERHQETLNVLMEGDDNEFHRALLYNQIISHFKHEGTECSTVNSTVAVRRILNLLTIKKLITIKTGKKDVKPTKSIYEGMILHDLTKADITGMSGLHLSCEITQAVSHELEHMITDKILNTIENEAEEVILPLEDFFDHETLFNFLQIEARTKKANWIVTSPVIVSMLQSNKGSKPPNREKLCEGESRMHGALAEHSIIPDVDGNDIHVYASIYSNINNVLMGRFDKDEDSPIMYLPELMMISEKNDNDDGFKVSAIDTFSIDDDRIDKYYSNVVIHFKKF